MAPRVWRVLGALALLSFCLPATFASLIIDDSGKNITFTGSWTVDKSSAYYGGTQHQTSSNGDQAVYYANAYTSVALYGSTVPGGAKFAMSVGAITQLCSCDSSTGETSPAPVLLCNITGLPSTLGYRYLKIKHEDAPGQVLTFDYLQLDDQPIVTSTSSSISTTATTQSTTSATDTPTTAPPPPPKSNKLSSGVIGGIVVGGVAVFLGFFAALVRCVYVRRSKYSAVDHTHAEAGDKRVSTLSAGVGSSPGDGLHAMADIDPEVLSVISRPADSRPTSRAGLFDDYNQRMSIVSRGSAYFPVATDHSRATSRNGLLSDFDHPGTSPSLSPSGLRDSYFGPAGPGYATEDGRRYSVPSSPPRARTHSWADDVTSALGSAPVSPPHDAHLSGHDEPRPE